MEKKTHSDEQPELNFIHDAPAPADAFGSHGRIARAVATAIHTGKESKVIGLLGAWGSGKSTVVHLMEKELKKLESKTTTYVFSYDAWLHQSDPARRSFLESLIKFLLDHKTGLSHAKWLGELEKLSRRKETSETTSTPTLTKTGRVALISLLLLPLAMQFIGYDWITHAFGKDAETAPHYVIWVVCAALVVLAFPVTFAFGLYLSWRPLRWPFKLSWWPFKKEFWSDHRHPHEDESIISLIMNKEVNKTGSTITREPDPTAIEFQKLFRDIMKEVSKADRRFIFVIDNLDRLPEDEAIKLWSTIRSFFLGASDAEEPKPAYMPTIILPVDKSAVARMYSNSNEEDLELARSFMEKTFDLTFRVTPPVLSDWRQYLTDGMKRVFGEYLGEDWAYIAANFVEKTISGPSPSDITPRMINTYINRIGTLWLQWRNEDVSFAAIAYYAIFLSEGEPQIQNEVTMPRATIFALDPDWQRGIASLFYGCKPAVAMQILIERPLRTSIEKLAVDEFKRLSGYPGFDTVLQRILEMPANGDVADPTFALNAAALLDTLNPADQPWVRFAWGNIRGAFRKPTSWQRFAENDADSFAKLMAHCSSSQATDILTALSQKLGLMNEALLNEAGLTEGFARMCLAASRAATQAHVALPEITVPGGQAVYLNVLAAAAKDEKLLAKLTTKMADNVIVSDLAKGLNNASVGLVPSKVKALMISKPAISWADFTVNASQIIQTQDVNFPGMNGALEGLGLLRLSSKDAQARIKELINGNAFVTRLNEAHPQKRLETEARLLALLLLDAPNFDSPNGQPWQTLLKDRPELVAQTDAMLLEFADADNFGTLVGRSKTNPNAKALIRGIASLRLREKRIGRIDVSDALDKLQDYLACLDDDVQPAFILEIAKAATFWDAIDVKNLDDNILFVLDILIAEGSGQEARARAVLEEKLKAVTTDNWDAALKSDGETYSVAMSLQKETKGGFHAGAALYDALDKEIPQLLASDDNAFRVRWFSALDLVNASSRKALLKTVRDRIAIGTSVLALLPLLKVGGERLFTEGAFADRADDVVRYIVWPLLEYPETIEWLKSQEEITRTWLAKSEESTRDVTVERLSTKWHAADDAGKEALSSLADIWSLPELPVEEEKEEEAKEGAE